MNSKRLITKLNWNADEAIAFCGGFPRPADRASDKRLLCTSMLPHRNLAELAGVETARHN
jgi:hypothetical protein